MKKQKQSNYTKLTCAILTKKKVKLLKLVIAKGNNSLSIHIPLQNFVALARGPSSSLPGTGCQERSKGDI